MVNETKVIIERFTKHRTSINIDIGDIVYLKTDEMQQERMVRGILIRPDGILYELIQGAYESIHYAFEITKEKDILKATS